MYFIILKNKVTKINFISFGLTFNRFFLSLLIKSLFNIKFTLILLIGLTILNVFLRALELVSSDSFPNYLVFCTIVLYSVLQGASNPSKL